MKQSHKNWESKKKDIEEKVAKRILLMDQCGIKRSVEAVRLECLKEAYDAIHELDEED